MKIILLPAPLGRKEIPKFPLGLAYISAVLNKHSVKIFDPNSVANPLEQLRRIIKEEQPDILGVSLTYIDTSNSYDKFSYYSFFVTCLKQVKEIRKDVKIIVGGAGFTLFAKQIMQEITDIDFGVLFEGEETICELLDNLDRPWVTKGICYRQKGAVYFTQKRDFLIFDNLPFPSRDILDIKNYKYFPEQMGIQTKRGCVFNCTYCTYPYVSGSQIRLRSPEKVVDEIEALSRLGLNNIFINDSTFNFPPEHAIQICQEIIKRRARVRWKAFFNDKFMSRRLFLQAQEAGCEVFIFGSEGNNQKDAENFKNILSLSKEKLIYNARQEGHKINFKLTFFFNGLNENIKTFLHTFRLILILSLRRRFQFEIGNMRIYPHTELFRLALKKKIIKEDTNLISSYYYDPFPLRAISSLLNFMGGCVYKVKRWIILKRLSLSLSK